MEPPLLRQMLTEPLLALPARTELLVIDPVSALTVLEAASTDSVAELHHKHMALLP